LIFFRIFSRLLAEPALAQSRRAGSLKSSCLFIERHGHARILGIRRPLNASAMCNWQRLLGYFPAT